MSDYLSNLTGTGNHPTANSVDLEWENDSNHTYTIVQYDNNGWVTLYTLAASATTKTVSVDNNTEYDFRILDGDLQPTNTLTIGNWQDTETATATMSSSSSEDIGYTDTDTETITMSSSSGEVGTYSDTDTETLTVSDSATAAAVTPLSTTFRYYYGSFEGKVYAESDELYSDDGTAIDAKWESKDLDFGDAFPEMNDRKKTVHKVRLVYVDKSNAASVEMGISTDGGTTWTTRNKSVGTGDGKTKNTEFFFMVTGVYFRFRIRNKSATDAFQWTRFIPFFVDAGEDF